MSTRAKARMRATDSPRTYKMLKKKVDLRCDRCPPHSGENKRKRPRGDRHKSERKGTARYLTAKAISLTRYWKKLEGK